MNTPRRTIRIEDELWTAAVSKANEEGTTVTEVIRTALRVFVATGTAVVIGALAFTGGTAAADDSAAVPSSAAAALMIAASCNADVNAVVTEIAATSDEARADLDAFYAAGETFQVEQARAKFAAGIPLTSSC